MLDISKFLMVNAVSTALLYEILVERRQRPRKVIIASSQAVYGEGQYTCPAHGLMFATRRTHEQLRQAQWEVRCPQCGAPCASRLLDETYTNPCNQYAVSKLSGEQVALGLGGIHQIPTVALRYSITQGPRQSLFNQYSGILRVFTARALAGEALIVYEDGRQTRDFIHVQDVVDAHFCVLNNESANFQAFNVGTGKATTILEYAELITRKAGREVRRTIPGQYRIGDNRHSVSSIDRLTRLGWRPQRSLSTILEDFLAWVDSIGGLPSDVPDAYMEMCTRGVIQPDC
jgi:dTDP-L-rhamnose 4-epimerase